LIGSWKSCRCIFNAKCPSAGEVVFFDRSWYNRAGVERVIGFAPDEEVDYFLKYEPEVERAISHSGIILIKYGLEVSMEVQDERLRARDAIFEATNTPENPWHVVDANDKHQSRLNCITYLLSQVPYEEVPREPVEFPEHQAKGDYVEPDYPNQMI
jgi:polyphosphate kinase 2 (PPK2 family)